MLKKISDLIWGPATPAVFAVIGLYFIIRVKLFSPRSLKYIFKSTVGSFGKSESNGGLNSFSAMATALGGTIGVGNTVGVAQAVIQGGKGAVLWMTVASFFGMAIKYAEIFLAVKFKREHRGGAMYYIKYGLNMPILAIVFALVCVVASFGMGNMAQSNAVSQYMQKSVGTAPYISGFICAAVTLFMISGGITRIGRVSAVTVPAMALIYIVMGLGIIAANIKNVPQAVHDIFASAFDAAAIGGGVGGFLTSSAIRYGFSRGLFSNEAGMGSSPTAHASSSESTPQKQAVWGIFEVFCDTVAVCGITALAIAVSDMSDDNPTNLIFGVFEGTYGAFGGYFLSISIVFFALASISCWYIYGKAALDFICNSKAVALFYRLIFCVAVYMGAVMSIDSVWNISDIANGIMAFINLFAIVLLAKQVKPPQ